MTKTNFDTPVLPGQNAFPRMNQPSKNPFSSTLGDKTVPKVQGARNEANSFNANTDLLATTTPKVGTSEYRVPANEAILPGQRPNTGPFDKNMVSSNLPQNARILKPEQVDTFMAELGEFMDGLRDSGNNVLGRYEELTNGGKIKKVVDGQEVEVKVGA